MSVRNFDDRLLKNGAVQNSEIILSIYLLLNECFHRFEKKIALHFAFFSSFEYYIFTCRTPIFLSVLERLQLNGGFFLKTSTKFFFK